MLLLLFLLFGEFVGGGEVVAHAALDVAHGEAVFDGVLGEFELGVCGQGDEGAGVACAEFARRDEGNDLGREG